MKRGFACGIFDLFHAGHVMMLRECREHCDYLIVGLNRAGNISPEINPGKNPPIYSFEERRMILESCRYVDEVISYDSEEELYALMKNLHISLRFLGDDYKGKPITGADLNIPVYWIDRGHGLSSTYYRGKLAQKKK